MDTIQQEPSSATLANHAHRRACTDPAQSRKRRSIRSCDSAKPDNVNDELQGTHNKLARLSMDMIPTNRQRRQSKTEQNLQPDHKKKVSVEKRPTRSRKNRIPNIAPFPIEFVERRSSSRVRARSRLEQHVAPQPLEICATTVALAVSDDDLSDLSDLSDEETIKNKPRSTGTRANVATSGGTKTPKKTTCPSKGSGQLHDRAKEAMQLQESVANMTESLHQLTRQLDVEKEEKSSVQRSNEQLTQQVDDLKLQLSRASKTIAALEIERAELSMATGTYAIDLSPMKASSEYRSFINEIFRIARSLITAPGNRERSDKIGSSVKQAIIQNFPNPGCIVIPQYISMKPLLNPIASTSLPDFELSQGHVAWYVTRCISYTLWAAYSSGNPVSSQLEQVDKLHLQLFPESSTSANSVEQSSDPVSKAMLYRVKHDVSRHWALAASNMPSYECSAWDAYVTSTTDKIRANLEMLDIQVANCTILGEDAQLKLKSLVGQAAHVWFLILAIDPNWHVRFPAPGTLVIDDPRISCRSVIRPVETRSAHTSTITLFAVHPSIVMGEGGPSAKDVIEAASVIGLEIASSTSLESQVNEIEQKSPQIIPNSLASHQKHQEIISMDLDSCSDVDSYKESTVPLISHTDTFDDQSSTSSGYTGLAAIHSFNATSLGFHHQGNRERSSSLTDDTPIPGLLS